MFISYNSLQGQHIDYKKVFNFNQKDFLSPKTKVILLEELFNSHLNSLNKCSISLLHLNS